MDGGPEDMEIGQQRGLTVSLNLIIPTIYCYDSLSGFSVLTNKTRNQTTNKTRASTLVKHRKKQQDLETKHVPENFSVRSFDEFSVCLNNFSSRRSPSVCKKRNSKSAKARVFG